jgi:hypothetical protein
MKCVVKPIDRELLVPDASKEGTVGKDLAILERVFAGAEKQVYLCLVCFCLVFVLPCLHVFRRHYDSECCSLLQRYFTFRPVRSIYVTAAILEPHLHHFGVHAGGDLSGRGTNVCGLGILRRDDSRRRERDR